MAASLLIHGIALLWFKPAPTATVRPIRPLVVKFVPQELPASGSRHLAAAQESSKTPASDEKPLAPLDASRLLESARRYAIEEEKQTAQEKNKRTDTPIGRLEKELRQPSTETRLANGMLKITTASGTTYCLQPPPHFVLNTPAAALYNIPTTCP